MQLQSWIQAHFPMLPHHGDALLMACSPGVNYHWTACQFMQVLMQMKATPINFFLGFV